MKIYGVSELEQFDHYDPFTDDLPPTLFWEIGSVPHRAKHLLKGRTLIQLKHALKILRDWRNFASRDTPTTLQQLYGDMDDFVYTDLQLMYFTRDGFDFSRNNPDKFNAAELFATLALGKIGAIFTSGHISETDAKTRVAVIEAVEALGFAEALLIDIIRNRKRSQTKKASIGKQYEPMKRWVVEEYLKLEPGMSVRKTAKILAERMPVEMRNRFATNDVHITIKKWLHQYQKGTLPNVSDLPPFPK